MSEARLNFEELGLLRGQRFGGQDQDEMNENVEAVQELWNKIKDERREKGIIPSWRGFMLALYGGVLWPGVILFMGLDKSSIIFWIFGAFAVVCICRALLIAFREKEWKIAVAIVVELGVIAGLQTLF